VLTFASRAMGPGSPLLSSFFGGEGGGVAPTPPKESPLSSLKSMLLSSLPKKNVAEDENKPNKPPSAWWRESVADVDVLPTVTQAGVAVATQVGVALFGLLFLTTTGSGIEDARGYSLDFEPWGTAAAVLFTWGIVRSEVLVASESVAAKVGLSLPGVCYMAMLAVILLCFERNITW
jgi:hypothetical protein